MAVLSTIVRFGVLPGENTSEAGLSLPSLQAF